MNKRKYKTVWFILLNYTNWYTCKGCHSARTAKLVAKRYSEELYAIPTYKRVPTIRN